MSASAGPAAIEGVSFRAIMATVCSPVTVVRGMAGDAPHGSTVSDFCSLSLNPPLVSVALDRSSNLLRVIRRTRRMGVNLLGHTHGELALTFAQKSTDKFDGIPWLDDCGLPRLDEAPGWLACDVERVVSGATT